MITDEGKNLVFLFSLPRSGSTVLGLILDNHSSLLCPPEPWFLLKLANLLKPWSVNILVDDRLATMGSNDFLKGETRLLATQSFAIAAYNNHLKKSKKRVFIDKTPRYYHILPLIDQAFPKARKIWLQRNPLDVAHSYLESWGLDIDSMVGKVFNTVSLDFSLGLFNLASYFSEPASEKCIVKYDDLVHFPDKTLKTICEFMQVEYEESMLNYAENNESIGKYKKASMGDKKAVKTRGLHTKSLNKWESGFSDEELTKIVQLLGCEIFRQMGYEKVLEKLKERKVDFSSEQDSKTRREVIAKRCASEITRMENQLSNLHNTFRPNLVKQKLLRYRTWWRAKFHRKYRPPSAKN